MSDKPWYRQFWPWFVMVPPLTAVVAGIGTVVIAARGADEVIRDGHVKEGLAIRAAPLLSETEARALVANLQWTSTGELTLSLNGAVAARSEHLTLKLRHPIDTGLDQTALLVKSADGVYRGGLDTPLEGRWGVELDAAEREWRMTGELDAATGFLTMGPMPR